MMNGFYRTNQSLFPLLHVEHVKTNDLDKLTRSS